MPSDTRIWVADLEMVLDQFLVDRILEKIQTHGQ